MRLGSLDVSIVRGADFRLDGGAMFGIVPKPLWERKFPADERNRIGLTTNCLLVREDGYTAVVEAGIERMNASTSSGRTPLRMLVEVEGVPKRKVLVWPLEEVAL